MPARRTSNAEKLQAGTYTPTRGRTEPRYVPEAPQPPSKLPRDAAKIWRKLVPQMARAKLLIGCDVHILSLFCCKAAEFYKGFGEDWKASDIAQYRMLMCELGLTPASRLRASPVVDDPEQPPCQNDQQAAQAAAASDPSGKIVSISRMLADMPERCLRGKSTPAATSDSPPSDK